MIKTILIDSDCQSLKCVEERIREHCPEISICGSASSFAEASDMIATFNPSLAFIDAEVPLKDDFQSFCNTTLSNLETVYLSSTTNFAAEAFKYKASGFILKPVEVSELLLTIRNIKERILHKEQLESITVKNQDKEQMPPGKLIGIPTFEGFDFIHVEEIIRCEGMQKCTRIITKNKQDLISSYNIGEFVKLLEPFQFFSTHKSHLVNLIHIKKYFKEGTLKMIDGSCIPVSKRKKSLFLNRMLLTR